MANGARLVTQQAADHCGCSVSHLNKLRVLGGGPVYLKLGRKVLYDIRDLDAWLEKSRRTSTSQPAPRAAA